MKMEKTADATYLPSWDLPPLTVQAAGSSLFGFFSSCTTSDSTTSYEYIIYEPTYDQGAQLGRHERMCVAREAQHIHHTTTSTRHETQENPPPIPRAYMRPLHRLEGQHGRPAIGALGPTGCRATSTGRPTDWYPTRQPGDRLTGSKADRLHMWLEAHVIVGHFVVALLEPFSHAREEAPLGVAVSTFVTVAAGHPEKFFHQRPRLLSALFPPAPERPADAGADPMLDDDPCRLVLQLIPPPAVRLELRQLGKGERLVLFAGLEPELGVHLLFTPKARLADYVTQLERRVIEGHVEADALVRRAGRRVRQAGLPQEDVHEGVAAGADRVERITHPRRVVSGAAGRLARPLALCGRVVPRGVGQRPERGRLVVGGGHDDEAVLRIPRVSWHVLPVKLPRHLGRGHVRCLLEHRLLLHVQQPPVGMPRGRADHDEADVEVLVGGSALGVARPFLVRAERLLAIDGLLVVPHQHHRDPGGAGQLEVVLHVAPPAGEVAAAAGGSGTPHPGAPELGQRRQQRGRLRQRGLRQHDEPELSRFVRLEGGRAEHHSGALLQLGLSLLVHGVALDLAVLDVRGGVEHVIAVDLFRIVDNLRDGCVGRGGQMC
eukprot:scaffold3811_cov116-Isochrysis_galbana.AAC.3